jgi:phosphoribosyl-ATP pyrophosphohydrolase
MYPFFMIPPSILTAAMVAVGRCVGNNILPFFTTGDKLKPAGDELKNVNMDELVKELVQKIKGQSPEVVKAIENIGREETVFDATDSIYFDQIAAAQEFLNENHNADLARVQRLLQKMIPERYYDAIAQLKEHQDSAVIYNIYGGQHLHAPNAREVEQNWEKK